MPSQPEEAEAGPSGLQMSSDDDEAYNELMDHLERQHAFQTNLLQQSGGGMDTNEEGAFDFELERFVDRKSDRMGVQETSFQDPVTSKGDLDSRSKHYPSSPRRITSSRRSSVNHHPRPPRSRSPLLYNSIRSPAQ